MILLIMGGSRQLWIFYQTCIILITCFTHILLGNEPLTLKLIQNHILKLYVFNAICILSKKLCIHMKLVQLSIETFYFSISVSLKIDITELFSDTQLKSFFL